MVRFVGHQELLSFIAAAIFLFFLPGGFSLGDTHSELDLDGLQCKLPGWPGHPAPTCDPAVPDQCCPGTRCRPDPYDPNHNTCQQTEEFTTAEHALTASVLTSHVQFLLNNAVDQLREASVGLYLLDPQQNLKNIEIVARAKSLANNHGNVQTGDHDQPKNSWHEKAHGMNPPKGTVDAKQPKVKQFESPTDVMKASKDDKKGANQNSPNQGGFDYSQYLPKTTPEKSKNPKGHDEHPGTGGYDYSKYYHSEPHPGPESKDKDKKKKSEDKHDPHKGDQGQFDYSQYYGGSQNDKKEDKSSPKRSNSGGDYDYSKYVPPQSKNMQNTDIHAGDDDFLRKAALELLQVDIQLQAAIGQTRRDLLERAKAVLNQLSSMVDRELDADSGANVGPHTQPNETNVTPGSVDDSGLAPELNPLPNEQTGSTQSPTSAWRHSNDDFWTKYIPDMPNEEAHNGDRRPGTLGGPCGRTDYKDFGPCLDKSQVCLGLGANRPGICRINRSSVAEFTRESALNSLKIAEEAVVAIKAASVELLVASSLAHSEDSAQKDQNRSSESIPLDPREYSPTMIFVVALGFAAIGYLCCVRRSSKRGSYNSIDGWGASGMA